MSMPSTILLMITCWVLTGKTSAACQMKPMNKHLGASINILCPSPSSCNGEKYNYVHFNAITGKAELVSQTSKYAKNLSSFDDGGDYCCSNRCADNNTSLTTPECCTSVTILPVVQWELPKVVALNGNAITGSCSASGYPRPDVRVIIPAGCDYQQKNIPVGNYTSKTVFTMNVTKHCEKIYCLISSKTYSVLRTEELLIVENVPSGCTRQVKSTSTAVKTSVSRENNVVRKRDTDEATTHARGNGVTTTVCSMMMITMTMLLCILLLH